MTEHSELYAQFLLEKVMKRTRYTGESLFQLTKAIDEVLSFHTSNPKPKTSDVALYIRARQHEYRLRVKK